MVYYWDNPRKIILLKGEYKIKHLIRSLLIGSIIALSFVGSREIRAATNDDYYVLGQTTTDTVRGGAVGWTTVGFYITGEEIPKGTVSRPGYGPIKQVDVPGSGKPYVTMLYSDSKSEYSIMHKVLSERGETQTFQYGIGKESFSKAISELKLKPDKDANGKSLGTYTIYLHSIIGIDPVENDMVKALRTSKKDQIKTINGYGGPNRTVSNGVRTNILGYFTNHADWYTALPWRDPSSYITHYNLKQTVDVGVAPVQAVTQTIDGEPLNIFQGSNDKGMSYVDKAATVGSCVDVGNVAETYVDGLGNKYALVKAFASKHKPVNYSKVTDTSKFYKHNGDDGSHTKISSTYSSVSKIGTTAYNNWIAEVKGGEYVVQPNDVGTTFYYIYAKVKDGGGTVVTTEVIEKKIEPPNPEGEIGPATYGSHKYDVEAGIPSGEKVYGNITTEDFLIGYRFVKKKGTTTFTVPVEYSYTKYYDYQAEVGKDEFGNPIYVTRQGSRGAYLVQYAKVTRNFEYWEVEKFELYEAKDAVLSNKVLPTGSMTIDNTSGNRYNVTYNKTAKTQDRAELYSGATKKVSTSYAGYGSPNINASTLQADAETVVKQFEVQNDTLVMNGQKLIDGAKTTQSQKGIAKIPVEPDETEMSSTEDYLKDNVAIPKNTRNNEYNSKGKITYELVHGIKQTWGNIKSWSIDINPVTVHTPVYVTGSVSNNKAQNQLATPVGADTIVMNVPFTVSYSNYGTHRSIQGYRTQDYAKYTDGTTVSFGFGVYSGNAYYPAGSQLPASGSYVVPPWVTEGYYEATFTTMAYNSLADDPVGNDANMSLSMYGATTTVPVYVTGRMYGFNIYDISDYPTWQKVFRSKIDQPTGNSYTVGTKNQNGGSNGKTSKYTLPMIDGKHPTFKNIGSLKTGYYLRFNLTTEGTMYSNKSSIQIKPRFYFVKKDGSAREEVDVYYDETIGSKKNVLVKVGSTVDSTNMKKTKLGSPQLMVPTNEIKNTATATGKTPSQIRGSWKQTWKFSQIGLESSLRTFVGSSTGAPNSVGKINAMKSIQKWYGEYYLPSAIYAAPKGYDVYGYGRKNSINFTESFWKRDGYVVVNFEIVSMKDGERNLSYTNPINSPNGYANMWQIEGFDKTQTDYNGANFVFLDGDVFLYKLTGTGGGKGDSASNDYGSGGTH